MIGPEREAKDAKIEGVWASISSVESRSRACEQRGLPGSEETNSIRVSIPPISHWLLQTSPNSQPAAPVAYSRPMFRSALPARSIPQNAPMQTIKVAGLGRASLSHSDKRYCHITDLLGSSLRQTQLRALLEGSRIRQQLETKSQLQTRRFHISSQVSRSQGKTASMRTDEVQFVHFNDVVSLIDTQVCPRPNCRQYHVPSPSVLTRFLNLRRDFAASKSSAQTLTVFSGDAFSPSLEASVLKGEQALPLLDIIGIDIGCYGNHDFDFGDARLMELSSQLKFPWLLSNAYHLPVEGKKRMLGSAEEYTIRDLDNGLRIGFIGLAGTDWPSNCEMLPPCYFEPPVDTARRLAHHLRVNERCDLVIALTHMRVPEDMAVANATTSGESRIDLLLGGHDHEVLRRFSGDADLIAQHVEQDRKISEVEMDGKVPDTEGDIRLVKSGTDWRALSLIRLSVKRDEQGKVVESTVNLRQYTDIEAAIPAPEPQSNVVEIIAEIHDRVGALVQKPLLRSAVPIDGRNGTIRSQETNMGNMLADAIRAFYDTDIGFFNSGAIRSDQVLKATAPDAEPLLVRDIINICPFGNGLLVKRIPGEVVKFALENGVSDMHTDGRFLQISGLRVVADWERPEGSRIVDVRVEKPDGSSEPFDPIRSYTVAMPTFIAQGYDGFTWFSQAETIVGEEAAMTDSGLLLAIFGHDRESSGGSESAHTVGVERARAQIVVGYNPSDSLPIVKPVVEDRIRFV